MSINSDFFFVSIKAIYPSFSRPSRLEEEIWEEVLEGYSVDDILLAVKAYRKNEETDVAPTPAKFKKYIFSKHSKVGTKNLPMSLEHHFMKLDKEAGREVYYFHIYTLGIDYVFDTKLKKILGNEKFNKLDYSSKYKLAVENGLFADFDKVLAKIREERIS